MANQVVMEKELQMKSTSRGERLRDNILSQAPQICAERVKIYTEMYEAYASEPTIIKRSRAFKELLSRMSIYIKEDELIVGNQASTPRSAPVFPETESLYILEEGLDSFQERRYDPFVVSPEVKKSLEEILPLWRGKTIEEIAAKKIPEDTFFLMEEISYKVFHPEIHFRGGIGHVSGGFERILEKGFEGLKGEAQRKLAGLDMSDPSSYAKREFYQAAKISCEAAIIFAKRFADLAVKLAVDERDARRKEELELIAEVCAQVPAKPVRSYHEALQAIWFSHLLLQIESNGLGVSPGRIDQYLYPFYKQDIDRGILTEETATELMECFWVKIEEIKRVYDAECAADFSGYTTGLNVTVGGLKADGSDATNEVSYICLDVQERLKTAHPNFTVRYNHKIPHDFLLRACEVTRTGTGMPEFMNDESHIPSLMNRGISLEDAREYTNIGCVEPAVPGKTCSWSNAAMFNLGKCLELALNDGKCLFTGNQIGVKTGAPDTFTNIEMIKDAFRKQVAFFVKHLIIALNAIDYTHREHLQTPYLSLLVDDCMEEGKDITAGGAHYNFTSPQGVGVADVADSFSAIDTLVFGKKTITMKQLLEAMKMNFEGYETERQYLVNHAPKYGNDDDYVDDFAKFAGRVYCEEVEKYRNPRGGYYNPGLYPVSAHVPLGRNVAAMASGREAKAPLADGVSPTHGSDKNGPTAVVNSVGKLDHMIASNGTLLNQKFHPSVVSSRKGLQGLTELIRRFFELGGKHIQFNIVDSNILREAQTNPDQYVGLAIRVAGYSAFFTQLSRDMQNDIIERTEQNEF